MAAISYSPKLSESKFQNWTKAGLAVLFTKEGIEPFVYDELKQFQQKCLTDICNNNGLTAGTTCSSCCTENVVVCPTKGTCVVARGNCSFHRNSATQYVSSGCPNKICHNFKSEIQSAHRFNRPSYKNTDATKWSSNPWEVSKCFLPPDGYIDATSAAETDFNGIISVIMNYEAFQSKVHDDLKKKDNIFDKGRNVGKAVRHSPNLEVEDTDLQQYFSTLKNLLSDPKYIGSTIAAQNALKKLSQLQNDTLVIGKDDVRKVLDDVTKAVQDKIRTEKDEYKKEVEKEKLELIKITNTSITAIERQEHTSISELNKVLKSAVDDIKEQTRNSIQQIQGEAGKQRNTIVTEGDTVVKQINEAGEAAVEKITSKSDEAFLQRMEKLKKDLKENLIVLYRQQYQMLPLSPLIEGEDTSLLEFYVMPDLNTVEIQRSLRGGSEIKSEVTSLRDVFYKKGHLCREIYLTADAGLGKTAFSKRLVLTWCQSFKPSENEEKYFKKEDIHAMSNFQFVFLLSLCDCSEECDIDEMIMKQIIPRLADTSITLSNLENVLSKEKCLVILDGLHEWIHPTSSCTLRPTSIPHRKARECTILTTTRPWKLSVINLSSFQIEQKLELVGLNEDSADKLKRSVISLLTDENENAIDKQVDDFNDAVHDKGISDLETFPLLLMYLLCLHCDGIELGRSKCELYCQITEMLLKQTLKRYPRMQLTGRQSQSDIPQCFREHEHCMNYYTFLTALGQLAFYTLFTESIESSLVFDSSIAVKCLGQHYLELSLLSGILTQSRGQVKLTKHCSKISFSHKTMQEYFCALHISCQNNSDIQKTIFRKCSSLQHILDMSTVFVFTSGLKAETISSISRILMKTINEDEITSKYRSMTMYELEFVCPLIEIQNMYISCIKEIPDSVELCLQDFIIDEDCQQQKFYTSLQQLAIQNRNSMKSLSIEIAGILSLQEIIDSFALSHQRNIQKILYRGECKEADLICLLSGSVKYVTIISNKWHGNDFIGIVSLWSSKLTGALQNMQLEAVNIDSFKMSHDDLEEFLNFLINRKSMKEIRLYRLFCTDHRSSCDLFSLDLSQHADLRTLALDNVPLFKFDINVSSLEDCDVGRLPKPGLVSSYLSVLPAASKLHTFRCSYLNSSGDIETVLHILPKLVHVKDVRLYNISLGGRLLSLSPEMVDIENVRLYNVKMSSSSLHNLVKVVEELPKSVTVDMGGCNITPEKEFERIKEYVQKSGSFAVIYDGSMKNDTYSFEFKTLKKTED